MKHAARSLPECNTWGIGVTGATGVCLFCSYTFRQLKAARHWGRKRRKIDKRHWIHVNKGKPTDWWSIWLSMNSCISKENLSTFIGTMMVLNATSHIAKGRRTLNLSLIGINFHMYTEHSPQKCLLCSSEKASHRKAYSPRLQSWCGVNQEIKVLKTSRAPKILCRKHEWNLTSTWTSTLLGAKIYFLDKFMTRSETRGYRNIRSTGYLCPGLVLRLSK